MKVLQIANDYRDNNLYEQLFTSINTGEMNQIVYVPFKRRLNLNEEKKYKLIHSNCYSEFDRFFFRKKSSKIFYDLEKKINLKEIQITHAHTLFSNGYIAYKLFKKYEIPYIISIRGTDVEVFLKKFFWLRGLAKEILENASKIIFLSPTLKNKTLFFLPELALYLEKNAVVHTNALHDFWINNILGEKRQVAKEIKLIQVGWINSNKNQLNTIKAVKILRDKGKKISLSIVGGVEFDKDRIYYNKVIEFIKEHSLGENVRLTGKLTKEKLIEEYRDADIFVLPSIKETLGLVYLEAMSQNLPVIYSKGQAIDGLFKKAEVGLVINPMDALNISESILEIAMNIEDYANSYLKVLPFNWNDIANDIRGYYTQSARTI